MIKAKAHLDKIDRPRQHFSDRLKETRLDFNELAPHIHDDLFSKIIQEITPDHLSAYPEMNALYQSLAQFFDMKEENLVITDGADGAIRQVIETFCNIGDELCAVIPTYGMYEAYAQIYQLEWNPISHKSDLTISIQDVMNGITSRTKMIILASPNGNVGTHFTEEELVSLIVLAKQKNILVVIDQAYYEFDPVPLHEKIDQFDNLILIRSFSKAWGLAGLRCGCVIACAQLAQAIYKLKSVVEVNSIAALAIQVAIKNYSLVAERIISVQQGKSWLEQKLRELGYPLKETHANFVQVQLGHHTMRVVEICERAGVRVKVNPRDSILNGWVRITAATPPIMERVCHLIEQVRL